MNLISSEFNFNSSFDSLIRNKPDGVFKECLVEETILNDKDHLILKYAYLLKNKFNFKIYLSVKIPYKSREKRIELVFFNNEKIFFCKFTNSKKVDMASIELQEILDVTKLLCPNIQIGLIVIDVYKENIITEKFASRYTPDIRLITQDKLISEEALSGVFNKQESIS